MQGCLLWIFSRLDTTLFPIPLLHIPTIMYQSSVAYCINPGFYPSPYIASSSNSWSLLLSSPGSHKIWHPNPIMQLAIYLPAVISDYSTCFAVITWYHCHLCFVQTEDRRWLGLGFLIKFLQQQQHSKCCSIRTLTCLLSHPSDNRDN